MLWDAVGEEAHDPAIVEPVRLTEVLFEYEGPKIFMAQAANGNELLYYESVFDSEDHMVRLIAVEADDAVVKQLKTGEVSVLTALTQRNVWALDQDIEGHVVRAVRLRDGIDSVPEDCRPREGVRLLPEYSYSR